MTSARLSGVDLMTHLYSGSMNAVLVAKSHSHFGPTVALTAIVLVALVRLLDPTKLRQLLNAVDPAWFIFSFVILIVQQIIAAERWHSLAAR